MLKSRGILPAVLLLCGCATSEPGVATFAPLGRLEPAPLYLVAARQKHRVEQSLRAAGVPLAPDLTQAVYLLRVTIGDEKDWHKCGSVNNVRYAVRKEGRDVLVLTASGPTGGCTPSVLDELSAHLRDSFTDAASPNPQPEEAH